MNEEDYSEPMTAKEFKEKILDVKLSLFENIYYSLSNVIAGFKFLVKDRLHILKYGYSQKDIWSMDTAFYKWVLPRLEEFKLKTRCYPNGTTFEQWMLDIDEALKKLRVIIKYEYEPWSCPSDYCTDEDLKYLKEKYGKDLEESYINNRSYLNVQNSFNKWFGKNVNNLWW